jgi:Pvc16 N-terminal domain
VNDFMALEAASETIRLLVRDHVNQVATGVTVALKAPDELAGATKAISIWLYRISRDPDLVNRPPERLADGQLERHPLPLDLHYLVTPLANEPTMAQDLLGRAMQTLNDHPVVRGGDLRNPLDRDRDQLRIFLEPLSVEDLTRLWVASRQPFRLSAGYLVQYVPLRTAHEPLPVKPVLERRSHYDQIVGVR